MSVPPKISKHNYYSFIWHAGFLALAKNFMDVDTVIPAMLIESGGTAMHIGIMTAIMVGLSRFAQIFFAPYISNKSYKKKFLLAGINSRVLSLFALGFILFYLRDNQSKLLLLYIFLFITLYSIGGAFANISYTDILGKSVNKQKRKAFFSSKEIISGVIVLFSALLAKKILTALNYPVNYALMFFLGGTLLLIASGGFWKIKEITSSSLKISGFKTFFKRMKTELTQNKNLVYFLGFINTQGIIISFLPFVIHYSKETFNTQSSDVGFYLLFKIIGIVVISMLVFIFSKRISYTPLQYFNVFLSIALILITLLIKDVFIIRVVFIMGGIAYSLFMITMNGLLLEVSTTENRAIYAGFVGAGNILPAVFPIAGGWIINQFGFRVFGSIVIIIILFSLFFIWKISCKK